MKVLLLVTLLFGLSAALSRDDGKKLINALKRIMAEKAQGGLPKGKEGSGSPPPKALPGNTLFAGLEGPPSEDRFAIDFITPQAMNTPVTFQDKNRYSSGVRALLETLFVNVLDPFANLAENTFASKEQFATFLDDNIIPVIQHLDQQFNETEDQAMILLLRALYAGTTEQGRKEPGCKNGPNPPLCAINMAFLAGDAIERGIFALYGSFYNETSGTYALGECNAFVDYLFTNNWDPELMDAEVVKQALLLDIGCDLENWGLIAERFDAMDTPAVSDLPLLAQFIFANSIITVIEESAGYSAWRFYMARWVVASAAERAQMEADAGFYKKKSLQIKEQMKRRTTRKL